MCRKYALWLCLVGVSLASSWQANAVTSAPPFEQCPTKAFLIQSPDVPIAYGVDLSLGTVTELKDDMGTTKINGAGFNYADGYLYGWDYGAATLAQIGSDLLSVPLNVTGLIDQTFFVGDVAVTENAWYGYRSGYGLYKVDLSDPSAQLSLDLVADTNTTGRLNITDIAFHPDLPMIYTVDNNGYLKTIDPSNGSVTNIDIETGEPLAPGKSNVPLFDKPNLDYSITFGAQYFDKSGSLYLSNNHNGFIFKIDLSNLPITAQFYAYGPSSRSNDGARCALAKVELPPNVIDYGDAPDSYGTSEANAGALHRINTLKLGRVSDAEDDAAIWPHSDEADFSSGVALNDEDGVTFPTSFEVGQPAIINVEVTGNNGYLNAWIDWDRNGSFASDEQIIDARAMSNGISSIVVAVPSWASAGATWARFRISERQSLGPTGGVDTGEVEDYPVQLIETGISQHLYPIGNDYTSFAFEDLYPQQGDFDMNDVVMWVNYTEYRSQNAVRRINLNGKLVALGASYKNGFAIRLDGIAANDIRADSIKLSIDGVPAQHQILDGTGNSAVLVVSENLSLWISDKGTGCAYYRTQAGCVGQAMPSWQLALAFENDIALSQMPAMPYNPFIFAAQGYQRNQAVTDAIGANPGRGLEVHLKNRLASDQFKRELFGRHDDASLEAQNLTFQSNQGIPWAVEIPTSWLPPLEGESLLHAYPDFKNYAEDGSGATNPIWYVLENALIGLLYQDAE